MIPTKLPPNTTIQDLTAQIDAENAKAKPLCMDESDIVRLPKLVGEFLDGAVVTLYKCCGDWVFKSCNESVRVEAHTPTAALLALEQQLTNQKGK